MSILIKETPMPESCSKCFVKPACCPAIRKRLESKYQPYTWIPANYRHEDCSLIAVSPHGRLGDLDKLEKMFADIDSAPYSCFDGAEPFYSAEDATHIIRLAPTVLEAEEGE